MAVKKQIKVSNKTDRPDNIVLKETELKNKCKTMEDELPDFLKSFFSYLKGSVLVASRYSYLCDITFFFKYLISETSISSAKTMKEITIDEINKIKARDINAFLNYCRQYTKEDENAVYVYENNNRTLARKKASISVMFKQLYRDELVDKNITDGFDPIKVPSIQEREIKTLEENEIMVMLDAVSTGEGLTEKQKVYWEKTKLRDKAILVLFLTYGLRLSELQQLNLSSFNFNRGEFKIYRKRGKEVLMPINQSVFECINEYIELEREVLNKNGEDALFLSMQGKRITERQIRQLVVKYTAIGMKTSFEGGYSPHKLRATTATVLIERGHSIFDVQALLDHDQVTTTQIYAAHKKNVKRDLVKELEWEEERKKK